VVKLISTHAFVAFAAFLVSPTTSQAAAPTPAAPADKMAYWSEQRRGANGGPTRLRPEWFQAAAEAGIDFIRLRPNELSPSGKDFLIGDADRYGGIPEQDLALLRDILDEADRRGLKIVLTMFSLPGCRWRQHNQGRDDYRLWRDETFQQQALQFWRDLATALKDHPAIVAYNPLNEPHPERGEGVSSTRDTAFAGWFAKIQGTTFDVNRFNRRMVAAIREVDSGTPILLDGWFYADPAGFAFNHPVDDPRTLYALHNLGPWDFTTYRINRDRFAYPERMPSRVGDGTELWTIDTLRALVRPVLEFAKRHDIAPHRIVASEFWCDRRIPGAAAYLTDEVRIYNEAGWHWAFYQFRPEGGFTGLDYEVAANARFGERYWQDADQGKDVEAQKPRGDTPIWNMLRGELRKP
jgi:endoglucanase